MATTSSRRPKRGYCPSTHTRYRAMWWGWLQPGKRRKHAARRESPCPLVRMAAYLPRRAWDEREPSFILWALWKKRLELEALSRFTNQDGCGVPVATGAV